MQNTGENERQLLNLMHRLRKLRLGDFPADHIDLSYSQMELIWFVRNNPGRHLQDVADGLNLTPPTVSVSIRRMEEDGWIERRADPDDGRATCIFITEKSAEAIQKLLAAQVKGVQVFLSQLSDDEQLQLLKVMQKAIEGVELQRQKQ
ncbi:MAG: MarR family transcriptional regulator [Anaerolineales bacterium]|jgi:DNA-binding MarR family transcriptional regulator